MSGILADADYDGTFYRIKSKNEEFLHSLQKMAWSLGIWCLIVNETTIFIDFHKDEGFEFDGVYIAKVEKLDYQEEMTCIYVDNEEHLYLTNDYIVTHNTTIVKPIIEELGFKEKEVAYAAYTGKAAQVLKSKGNKNIMTLHKLLYNNVPMKYGGYIHIPKTKLRYKVIIVDETSMLTDGIIDRLLYHDGIYFIFLGDANQLPPVMGKTNKLMENPHVHLDEIVRQGEESDIINLSVDILENVKLEQESYKNGDVLLFEREELTTGILDWADIVICGKNVTKNYFNNEIRAMRGLPQHLTEGDKVICRKNAYEFCSEQNQDFLVNGTLGTVHNIREDVFKVPTWTLDKDLRGKDMPIYICDLELDNGDVFKNIRIDRTALESENGLGLTQQVYTDIVRNSKRYRPPANLPFPFAYGYAITCHNAQGSQWDKVLVVEENYPFNPKEHKQWLYTATTRAAKKLVLIREPR
jgi:exodeoxyribonuclease-5